MHHQSHGGNEEDAHRQGEIHALTDIEEEADHYPADQGSCNGHFLEGQADSAQPLFLQADQLNFIGLKHQQVVDDAGGAGTQHAEVGDQGAD